MNLSRIRGSVSGRFSSAFSLSEPLETSNTLFQDALALLPLIFFAEISFHRWDSALENYRISLDSISTWKQYLHMPGAQSFITSERLEASCGVVSSLLEEREDSAEEAIVLQSSPTKATRISAGKMEPATDTTYPPKCSCRSPFFILQGPGHTVPRHMTGPSQILVF